MLTNWIREREAAKSLDAIKTRMRAAVRLGIEGHSASYKGLAAFALALSQDETTLRKESTRFLTSDTLKSLYRIASMTGVSPLAVWGIYVASLVNAVDTEPVEEKLAELLAYSALGDLIAEREAMRFVEPDNRL